MTTDRRWMAIYFGLVAWLWCTSAVFAQAPAPMSRPDEASRLSVAPALSGIWDTIGWVERRYKIEAMRFKARDESGADWRGSDEVMVGTYETYDHKGWTVTDEIGDIDSGDTHHFDPAKSCIIAVRPGIVVLGKTSVCDDVGEPAPLSFRVEFWEKDLFGIPVGYCYIADHPWHHRGPHCADDGNGDDFMGSAQIDLSAQDLEAALHNVGDEYTETVVLDHCGGAGLCGAADSPDYTFTYRITRMGDVRVGLPSLLEQAMRRSGARSELEAIVAGLRSLRAPGPRKIEPETASPSTER